MSPCKSIVIGYNKDFSFAYNQSILYESMSDRIDYIRNKKEPFILIPKFICSGPAALRKVYIERRSDLPLRNFRKKNQPFLHVQKDSFYNSREIEVNCIPLRDINVDDQTVLFINYGDISDIISSAGNKFYRFKEIYIHKDITITHRDNLLLERYFFIQEEVDSKYEHYLYYRSHKPLLNVKIVRYSELKSLLEVNDYEHGMCILCPDYYEKSNLPSLYEYSTIEKDTIYIEKDDSKISDIFIFSSLENMITLANYIIEKKIILTNKLHGHLNLKIFFKD